MKAVIDLALCQGHGQCQEAAPNVFEVRDDGYAYLLVDAIPAAEEANAAAKSTRRTAAPAEANFVSGSVGDMGPLPGSPRAHPVRLEQLRRLRCPT